MDREKVIKGMELLYDRLLDAAKRDAIAMLDALMVANAITMLKEQDNEAKRIMKVIWDTLHEGFSIDTIADQDWVYEQIRHRIEDI